MDTKLKKRKLIASFAVFFLSVSLILANGAVLLNRLVSMDNGEEYSLSRLMEQDYQNTGQFRCFIQGRLSDFIAMASGGKIGTYFDVGGYWENVSGVRIGSYADELYWQNIELEEKSVNHTADASQPEGSSGGGTSDERKKREEQYAAEAEAYHEAIRENKNMLYRISNAGRQVYSNMDETGWDKSNKTLPDGYNFLLIFSQGRVSIVKDGVEQEIYGDGYYRSGEQWYVPGYKNFTADKGMENVEVIILAAQNPVPYSHVKYGQGGYRQTENRLYYIAEDVRYQYEAVRRSLAGLLAGVLLAAASILLRKHKKAADEAVARFTGRIWIEAKCVILLLVLMYTGAAGYAQAGQAVIGTAEISEDIAAQEQAAAGRWYAQSSVDVISNEASEAVPDENIAFEEQAVQWGTENLTWSLPRLNLYILLEQTALNTGSFLVIFWILYLIVNDIRKNKGHFGDGLIRRIWQRAETDSLKQPFAVQQVRSYLFFAAAAAAAVCAMLLLSVLYGRRFLNLAELVFWMIVILAVFLLLLLRCLSVQKKKAQELDLVADYILAVQGGDYTPKEDLAEDSGFKQLFDSLHQIRQGMETAVDQQLKSERMKVELVANVSHDLKTPLTSIISYIAFLKQEEGLPEHVQDYIRILDEKAGRLNAIVQDVFAVSKAASGQLPIELERLDFGKLLRQTLADMLEQIQAAPVTIKADIAAEEVHIIADGSRMYRVFQNLIQNALKYSLEGSRIFIDLKQDGAYAAASIKNISRKELAKGTDFTQRFLRGDESRTDGGAGLGLSIAKSFTEACGGEFQLEADADLFSVTIRFKQDR